MAALISADGAGHTEWVVLDLGETLVDETGMWALWATYLDIPTLTFFAALGAVISQRRPHTDVFAVFRPDFDLAAEEESKRAAGLGWTMSESDLYPDALPTLVRLSELGYRVAVMANQPASSQSFLAQLPLDRYATSAGWGVAKPDPAFFARVAAELDVEPQRIAYVGDRIDNDVLPALAAGMLAIHLRRGPWGVIGSSWAEAAQAHARISSLTELPAALAALGG